jgi:hypothetical protein
VGQKIVKFFGESTSNTSPGWYHGVVSSIDVGENEEFLYLVTYEDGDKEDLSEEEVRQTIAFHQRWVLPSDASRNEFIESPKIANRSDAFASFAYETARHDLKKN